MPENHPEKPNEALSAAPHPVYQPPTAETPLPEGTILRSQLPKIVQRNLRYFQNLSERADQALDNLGMSSGKTTEEPTGADLSPKEDIFATPSKTLLAGEALFAASDQTDEQGRPLLAQRAPLVRLRQSRQAHVREIEAGTFVMPDVMIESPRAAQEAFLPTQGTWAAIRQAREGLPAVETMRTPSSQPDFTGNSTAPTVPTPIIHKGMLPLPEATPAEQLAPLPETSAGAVPIASPPNRATHTYEIPVEAILGYRPMA